MDQRIQHVCDLLEQHYQQRLSVADMARWVNLSPSRFSHLFRAEAGTTPLAYLRARRMRQSCILLTTSWLSVKQVTCLAGFSDPGHFSRDFRKRHGSSPKQYRRHP